MSKRLQLCTIIIIYILAGVEVDLFVPSFPELQESFNLSPLLVELTLGANFCAYCMSSLCAGDLGDRYGLRSLILIGLGVFIAGSFMCVYAPSFIFLILGRILQGTGIASPAVLSYVIIANTYPVDQQQKLMGLLNGVVTLAMAFAPVAGSYVNLWYGWQGNFMILLILGITCFLLAYFLIPNDQSAQKKATPYHSPINAYLAIFQSPQAMVFTMAICCLVVPYWVFIGMAPILYMEDFGVNLEKFGFYQGALAITFSAVSLGSGIFLRYYGQYQCFRFGVMLTVLSTFLIVGLVIFDIRQPLVITGVLLLFSVGVVMPVNILYPLALESQQNAKGRMAAIIQALRLILTALGLEMGGYFYSGSFRPLGILMAGSLGFAFFFIRSMQHEQLLKWQS